MKHKFILILFLFLIFLISCNQQKTEHEKKMESMKIAAATEAQKTRAKTAEILAEQKRTLADAEKIKAKAMETQSEVALKMQKNLNKNSMQLMGIHIQEKHQIMIGATMVILLLIGVIIYLAQKKGGDIYNDNRSVTFNLPNGDTKKITDNYEDIEFILRDINQSFLLKKQNRNGT